MLATIAVFAIVDWIDGEHLVDMYVVVHSTIESSSVSEGVKRPRRISLENSAHRRSVSSLPGLQTQKDNYVHVPK